MTPLQALFIALIWALFALGLVDVLRKAFREGFKPRHIAGIALLSIAVSMRIVAAYVELNLSTVMVESYDAMEKPPTYPSADRISPERREQLTTTAARSVYWTLGTLMPVTNAEGKQYTFVPTEQDLRRREDWVTTKARLQQIHINGRRRLWEEIGMLAGVALCAMLMINEDRAGLRAKAK